MESEAELDAEIKGVSILTDYGELYEEFARAGGAEKLVGLLAHDNADIAIAAVESIAELVDEDVEESMHRRSRRRVSRGGEGRAVPPTPLRDVADHDESICVSTCLRLHASAGGGKGRVARRGRQQGPDNPRPTRRETGRAARPRRRLRLPSLPPALKSIAPFLQHTHELKSRDPIMAYWCAYYAAQVGISLKLTKTFHVVFV